MMKNQRLRDILDSTGEFRLILESQNHIFLANRIDDLTAFYCPSFRQFKNIYRLDLELGITTTRDTFDRDAEFKKNIVDGFYVILPRTVATCDTEAMFVRDGVLSRKAIEIMKNDLSKYSVNSCNAKLILEDYEDKFISSLRKIYKDKFEEIILRRIGA